MRESRCNILIINKNKGASDQNTILTLKLLADWGYKASKGKVQISQPTVKYLGFELSERRRLSAWRRPRCNLFSPPESRFIWPQLPPPCRLSWTPTIAKLYTRGVSVGKFMPHLPWPPRSAPGSICKIRLVRTSPRQLVIGRVWGVPFRTDRPRLRWTFCLCPDHQSPKGTTKRRKKAEKH